MSDLPQASLRIGSRGSPLALAQAEETKRRLLALRPGLAVEIVVIRTTGDRVRDRPLAEVGGKGLFTKELEEALLGGGIDLAVHSCKDMPTWLPDGLCIGAILPRVDPRDALIAREVTRLADLPAGAVVGTASLRRQAQILHLRPDVTVLTLRGNVGTRLDKVASGAVAATLLARAGLERLGLLDKASAVLSTDEMLPAAAQGAIAIECRAGDEPTRNLLGALNHPASADCVSAERAMLAVLEGSCRTPIAGLAEIDGGGRIALRALLLSPDGKIALATRREGTPEDAVRLGEDAGEELKRRAPSGLLASG